MLERLKDLPRGVEGLKAVGKLSKDDYEQVMQPLLDEARDEGRRLRLLYQFGPEFEGFTVGAAWEDARIGLQSLRLFDGCAVVSDVGWIRDSTSLAGFMLACPVRVFENRERSAAAQWLESLPEGAAATHRLIPESGVSSSRSHKPWRPGLRRTGHDGGRMIESHGSLQGLVVMRASTGIGRARGLSRHLPSSAS